jgi:hypothetical protein
VISNNTRLNEKAQALVSQLQQVEAQLQLSLESLHFDESEAKKIDFCKLYSVFAQIHCIQNTINPLTPELNPSTQRSLLRFFSGDFKF